MRILFFSDNFPPERNAAATRVYERALYWVRWGHEVTVLTCAPNFPEGRVFAGYSNRWHVVENMDGIRVVRVKTFIAPNKGRALRIFDFMSYMASAGVAGLFEKDVDVIMATSPQFFAAVGGWGLAFVKRRPFIFELGDLWPASIKAVGAMREGLLLRLVEKVELFLYRRSAVVVALTESFKEDLVSRGIPENKVQVVINGVDLPRYQPKPRDRDLAKQWNLQDRFVVGYLGTLGMAHGLENVLDAARLALESADDFHRRLHFLFVGAGAAKSVLEEKAKKENLTNVTFIPSQPKERMPEFWSLCDVALVHLKNDPVFSTVIPSKIFEIMGMGLPIVLAGPDGEAARIVRKEGAGLVVEPGQPEVLLEAVAGLARDDHQRRELARASHQAAPRYSRETQARRVVEILRAVVEKSPRIPTSEGEIEGG